MQVVQYNDDKIKSIRSPLIFIGLPDVGLVGSIAVSYIIDKLNMIEIGYMDSDLLPPVVLVKDSVVKNAIRLYASNNGYDNDIVAIISDIPLPSPLVIQFAKSITSWFKGIDARLVVNITGIPVQNRLQIDKPQVLYVLTNTNGNSTLNIKSTKAMELKDGIIVGVYASIIKSCITTNIPTLTLLAQSHLNFPDPFASVEALEVVNTALSLNIDLSELKQEAELIRIKTRELMKQTASVLTEAKASPTFYG